MCQCGIAGVQLDVRAKCQRAGQYTWVFVERDQHMDHAKDVKNIDADWAYIQSIVFGDEPRRYFDSNRRRG